MPASPPPIPIPIPTNYTVSRDETTGIQYINADYGEVYKNDSDAVVHIAVALSNKVNRENRPCPCGRYCP